MAYIDKYLKDPEYANWVKSGLALNITNEVLRPFVVKEITKLHHSIVKTLPPGVSCTGCSVDKACPKGICDEIQREIENKHWYPNPSFTNTCTERWSTEPWEIAKCFMPPSKGCRDISTKDPDFSACINVIINCKHFQAFGTRDPNITETDYSKSRDFRNRVMHASPQKVTENDMTKNLDILINILNMIKTPETEDNTKKAIAKIQKIQADQLTIKLGDVIEVQRTATEAIADKREKNKDQVQRERMLVNFEAGCRKALCKLTEEHISKQKGNLSVAAFLSKVEILAVIKNLCSKHKEMLFPENGTHEDIREWDLFVYCFILEELELSEPLENAVSIFVQEVKKIRNSLLLDATRVIQNNLSELCEYLINTDLKTEITDIFNKDSPDVDVIRSFNILGSWWREEEDYVKKPVSKKQLNDSKQDIKELDEKIGKRVEKWFAENEDKIIRKLLEAKKHRGEKALLQEAISAGTGLDAECELKTRGCDEEIREALEEHITSPDNTDIERNEAFEHFRDQIDLREVNPVEGSIILNVKCSSITNVIDFWDSCIDGRAVQALSKVRDYYRRYFKCDTLEFDVILTKKGVSRCVNEIVEGLPSRFEVLVDNVIYKVQEIVKAKGSEPLAPLTSLPAEGKRKPLAPLEPMQAETRICAHLSVSKKQLNDSKQDIKELDEKIGKRVEKSLAETNHKIIQKYLEAKKPRGEKALLQEAISAGTGLVSKKQLNNSKQAMKGLDEKIGESVEKSFAEREDTLFIKLLEGLKHPGVYATLQGTNTAGLGFVDVLPSSFEVLDDTVAYKVQEISEARDMNPTTGPDKDSTVVKEGPDPSFKSDITSIPGLGKDSMILDDGSDIMVKSETHSLSLLKEIDIRAEEERITEGKQTDRPSYGLFTREIMSSGHLSEKDVISKPQLREPTTSKYGQTFGKNLKTFRTLQELSSVESDPETASTLYTKPEKKPVN